MVHSMAPQKSLHSPEVIKSSKKKMEQQRKVTPKRENPYQDQNQYPGAAQEQRSDLSDKNMSV